MKKSDSEKIIILAKEGKRISKIWQDDFPQYSYDDIYVEVYGADARSALGTMRMITNRVNKLKKHSKANQQSTLDEINDFADYLYRGLKDDQIKLEKIRKALDK